MDTLTRIRNYPLLALADPRLVDAWLAAALLLDVGTGDTLLQAGTEGAWVYLVLDGTVRVLRPTRSGREVSLGMYGPGDLFGENPFLVVHRVNEVADLALRFRKNPNLVWIPYFQV